MDLAITPARVAAARRALAAEAMAAAEDRELDLLDVLDAAAAYLGGAEGAHGSAESGRRFCTRPQDTGPRANPKRAATWPVASSEIA